MSPAHRQGVRAVQSKKKEPKKRKEKLQLAPEIPRLMTDNITQHKRTNWKRTDAANTYHSLVVCFAGVRVCGTCVCSRDLFMNQLIWSIGQV